MTPQEFITKWQRANLSESSACQQHFLDLCELLGQPKPAAADPDGAWYTFERGVRKAGGGQGWADVWMRGRFGWEYKGKHKDLVEAYKQLNLYRESLENPPLLVVCDLDRFEIHTNFTGTVKQTYAFDLAGLADSKNLDVLRKLFTDPEALRPGETSVGITEDASRRIAIIADGMRDRGVPAPDAAHFLMKLMFCMFGEDIGLLPDCVFSDVLAGSRSDPERLTKRLKSLFGVMSTGGDFGTEEIPYFNGGLFADAEVIELTPGEIAELVKANVFDWADVEPSIFGSLFERTLDPTKRAQIGAHYTSREDIVTLLEPVVMAPLRREWADTKSKCEALWDEMKASGAGTRMVAPARRKTTAAPKKTKAKRDPRKLHDRELLNFVERLGEVTILDPACGSGNFLYVAINLLLDLQKEVIAYASTRGVPVLPNVRPTQLAGIEVNPYAQQLAQVVIWIGYLQWMHHNGFNPPRNPVLEPIESIQLRDAILDLSDPNNPKEPEWPKADFIVGNPPFLGDKKMRGALGDKYVASVRKLYAGRVSGQSDLCCYWFEKARLQIGRGNGIRAGLLATQGIRGGKNRGVVDRIKETADIFFAVSDRNWILDGAMVHVSLVGFDNGTEKVRSLNGAAVDVIYSNLTAGSVGGATITQARPLAENQGKCFLGVMKAGSFDISEELAFKLLRTPNAHGIANSDVLRMRLTARDILQRLPQRWIVDFGCDASMSDASKYSGPFEYVAEHVKPERADNRRKRLLQEWWIHGESRPGMRNALLGFKRFVVTPEVSKHRVFVWLDAVFLADHQTRVFATQDDDVFGILHSKAHELWARAPGIGTQVRERESGFRYTPSTCFETFPFPTPTDAQRAAIAAAAKELDRLRNNWLNPPEWTRIEVLEFPGSVDGPWSRFLTEADSRGMGTVRYPRVMAKDAETAPKLAKQTLTNLYNARPTWLDLAHKRLDEAVFAAYGWDPTIGDDEILAKLLDLNLSRPQA